MRRRTPANFPRMKYRRGRRILRRYGELAALVDMSVLAIEVMRRDLTRLGETVATVTVSLDGLRKEQKQCATTTSQ